MNAIKTLLGLSIFSVAISAMAETNVASVAAAAAAKAKEDRIMDLLGTGSDPFRFEQGTSGGRGVSPHISGQMDLSKISSAIRVKGVLVLEGHEPSALIMVGKGAVQLVRRDDLIMMPNSAPAERGGQGAVVAKKACYLLVKEIIKDSVIVAPEQRPQDLIKIR